MFLRFGMADLGSPDTCRHQIPTSAPVRISLLGSLVPNRLGQAAVVAPVDRSEGRYFNWIEVVQGHFDAR